MASFAIHGAAAPASPVVLSVPHAGRDYPPELIAALRVPLPALQSLEDRLIDAVALAARGGAATIVQARARAWIDLNRAEQERDPRVDLGADPLRQPFVSPKVRAGLGLVPRRAAGVADIWRGRFAAADIARRIAEDHRPYHAQLAALLSAARARFGAAVLLDLHSMPPLGAGQPRVVIGDRFGRSAAARFVARVEAETAAHGIAAALNAPYAGGHILERHGAPAGGIHAIQLELDRSLYLAPGHATLGPGLAATVRMVAAIVAGLADEALAGRQRLAAE